MLLIHYGIRHDSYYIKPRSKLEAVAVMVPTTQHQQLLIVSGYNPPNNNLLREDITDLFHLQIPTLVMGDLNSKHGAWNCATTNRNGTTLLNVYTDYDITIAAPLHYTHYPPLGQASTLDMVMYRGCNISTPQTISALSSDHNPVVYKVRLTPHHTARKQFYDYHRANWAQYQHILAAILKNPPRIKGQRDFDRALHTITATILMAAEQTIPKRTTHRKSSSIPKHIHTLLRIRNYIRRQYQRTRQAWIGYILQLLTNMTTNSLYAYHNL
jgi:hypothetical protein